MSVINYQRITRRYIKAIIELPIYFSILFITFSFFTGIEITESINTLISGAFQEWKYIILALIILFAVIAWSDKNEWEYIDGWCEINNLELLSAKECNILQTPLKDIWNVVYLLKIKNNQGDYGEVWLNLGFRGQGPLKTTWKILIKDNFVDKTT
jgi:hypothetical protein